MSDRSFYFRNINSTGAPQNMTAAGSLTSLDVPCRGAKAVHFIVRSTTDADTFAASQLNLRTRLNELSSAIEGSTGLTLAGTQNGVVGTTGFCVTVTNAAGIDTRLAHYALGVRLVAGANAIDNVAIDAMVVYD